MKIKDIPQPRSDMAKCIKVFKKNSGLPFLPHSTTEDQIICRNTLQMLEDYLDVFIISSFPHPLNAANIFFFLASPHDL